MLLADPQTHPELYQSVPVKRLFAWCVDTVIIFVLSLAALPFTLFLGALVFLPLMLCIGFAYRVITLARGSATWGMRLMSIELRDASGGRFDAFHAFWHTAGYTICLSIFPLQLVSVVLMLISERGQGLSDHALGTVAINRVQS